MLIRNVCLLVIWPSDWLLALRWDSFFCPCDSFLATVPVIVHGDVAHPLAWYHAINCITRFNIIDCDCFMRQFNFDIAVKETLKLKEKALDKTIQDLERMVDKTPLTNLTIVS